MVLRSMKGVHLETGFVDFETSSHTGGGGGQVVRSCNPCTPVMVFSVRYAICKGPKLDT